MRRWFDLHPTLRAPDDDRGGGGSDTVRTIDPGAEHEMDDEPVTRTPATPKPAAADEDLRAEVARLRKQADDNAADAKFWADRARARGAAPARTAADDDEPAPPRRQPAAEPAVAEKPQDLIDDLNTKGLQALKDRGFISKTELEDAIADIRATTSAEISDARSEAVFSGRLEAEFPEMMEDSARVAKGLAPKSDLFVKAGEIYRELVDLDPSLKNSRGLLLIAARQAKESLKGGKGGNRSGEADDEDLPPSKRRAAAADDQATRRAKIDRQTPDRRREPEEEGAGHHSDAALEVMKRLKVKPDDYNKHRDGGTRNGRR